MTSSPFAIGPNSAAEVTGRPPRANPAIATISIEDDLAGTHTGAIEVTIGLDSGPDRWCFFITPAALATCGDSIPGTAARVHRGESHMIVVSDISTEIVRVVLAGIEADGLLMHHTRAIHDS